MYSLAIRKCTSPHPSPEVENLLPCRGSNLGPAGPEADMLPSEPARQAGFSSVDDDILTTETLTAEDILTDVKNQQNSASDEKNLQDEEDSGEQEIEVNVPTISEALQAISA